MEYKLLKSSQLARNNPIHTSFITDFEFFSIISDTELHVNEYFDFGREVPNKHPNISNYKN